MVMNEGLAASGPMNTYGDGSNNTVTHNYAGSLAGSKKSPIKIKKKNKGKFTDYCKSQGFEGVTKKCIAKGKVSKNPTTRKRATFAKNARGWNK
jgi:hypothetical protein